MYKTPKTKITDTFTPDSIRGMKSMGAISDKEASGIAKKAMMPIKKKSIVSKIKNKVVDVTSDILSAPARYKANKSIAESNRVADAIKMTREAKGAQDGGDYRDPLFRARATAAAAKVSMKPKKK